MRRVLTRFFFRTSEDACRCRRRRRRPLRPFFPAFFLFSLRSSCRMFFLRDVFVRQVIDKRAMDPKLKPLLDQFHVEIQVKCFFVVCMCVRSAGHLLSAAYHLFRDNGLAHPLCETSITTLHPTPNPRPIRFAQSTIGSHVGQIDHDLSRSSTVDRNQPL